MDRKAEQHVVVQGHKVIATFPGMTEANNRAASIASASPFEVWVVHMIGSYEGGGSVCFTTNHGDMYGTDSVFDPDGNLELPSNN